MDNQAVLLLGSDNLNLLVCRLNITRIAYLTSRISVERSLVEYHLVRNLILRLHLAHTSDTDICLQSVVAHELLVLGIGDKFPPIVNILCCGIARTLFLRLQLLLELLQIDLYALLLGNKFGQVDWKSVCIVEQECVFTRNFAVALLDNALQEVDTRSEGTEERCLLLLDNTLHERLLRL